MQTERHDEVSVKEDRSIGSLIKDLTHQLSSLVQGEVQLAKTEISEKISQLGSGVVSLLIAGVLLLAGLLFLLDAAAFGISEVLGPELSPWLGKLIIGVVVVVIGFILLKTAQSKLKAKELMPTRTTDSIRKDKEVAQEHLR